MKRSPICRKIMLLMVFLLAMLIMGCGLGPFNQLTDQGPSITVFFSGLDITSSETGDSISRSARALDVSGIDYAEVTIDALNFSFPVTETVVLSSGSGSASISGLELGPNRVITVIGYDSSGNPVPEAELYGTVDIYPGNNNATVNWDSTARGKVYNDLLNFDKLNGTTYSIDVYAAEVQTLIETIISDENLNNSVLIDSTALSDSIISSSGSIPLPLSGSFVIFPGTVSLNVTGLGASTDSVTITMITAAYGSECSWTITDSLGTVVVSGSGYSSSSTNTTTEDLTAGDYTLNLSDSYGDGWHGGSISISSGVVTLVDQATVTSSSNTVSFTVPGSFDLGGWPIELRVTDPASAPIILTGNGTYTVESILPGDWNLVLSINNGIYTEVLILDSVVANSATSTATDSSGTQINLTGPWDLSGVLTATIGYADAFQNPTDITTTTTSSTVTQINTNVSGNVTGYVSFTDQDNDPLSGLNSYNFLIEESLNQSSWTTMSSGSVTVTTVSNSGQAINSVITMDYSGSMSSTDITNMETATGEFISSMSAGDQAAIFKFGGDIELYPSSGFSSDQSVLNGYVSTNFTGNTGSTALFDTVGAGMERLVSESPLGVKAVIAFTDGSDNGSNSWNQQSVIDYSNTYSVPIYSIGFGSADTTTLENIATSGIYEYAPNSSTLSTLYNQIANRMQETYVIDWVTIGNSGETVYVRITVTYTCANGTFTDVTTSSYTL